MGKPIDRRLKKAYRRTSQLRKALRDMYEMLEDWNSVPNAHLSGFAGMHATRQAERLLGLPQTHVE